MQNIKVSTNNWELIYGLKRLYEDNLEKGLIILFINYKLYFIILQNIYISVLYIALILEEKGIIIYGIDPQIVTRYILFKNRIFIIFIERFLKTTCIKSAIALLYMSYFIFNISYPNNFILILTFI